MTFSTNCQELLDPIRPNLAEPVFLFIPWRQPAHHWSGSLGPPPFVLRKTNSFRPNSRPPAIVVRWYGFGISQLAAIHVRRYQFGTELPARTAGRTPSCSLSYTQKASGYILRAVTCWYIWKARCSHHMEGIQATSASIILTIWDGLGVYLGLSREHKFSKILTRQPEPVKAQQEMQIDIGRPPPDTVFTQS